MARKKSLYTAKCIACTKNVDLGDTPRKGMMVKCPNCGMKLEVIRINPPLLDWPLPVVEDRKDAFAND